jgi:hypothetical protein
MLGSRRNLLARAGRQLQAAYSRRRAAHGAAVDDLRDAGFFRAPFEPIHGRQAELGLPEPLILDLCQAEAA